MKKSTAIHLFIFFVSAIAAGAQTQTITLSATNGLPISYKTSTNQIININSFIQNFQSPGIPSGSGLATISYHNGLVTIISPNAYGLIANGNSPAVFNGSAVFTGVTNILVSAYFDAVALTFTITTPTIQSTIPANAVVIPTDATGPVQIVLESSSDLVNWTSSLPGTYGNTYSNRFFRVRAIAQ